MWIARDEDKCLYLYKRRPEKDIHRGGWQKQEKSDGICLFDDWFPEVKWEDEEPRELILK